MSNSLWLPVVRLWRVRSSQSARWRWPGPAVWSVHASLTLRLESVHDFACGFNRRRPWIVLVIELIRQYLQGLYISIRGKGHSIKSRLPGGSHHIGSTTHKAAKSAKTNELSSKTRKWFFFEVFYHYNMYKMSMRIIHRDAPKPTTRDVGLM